MGLGIVEDAEREGRLIRRWTHEGVECAMVNAFLGCAGYVRLPGGVWADTDDFHVHGGITWGPDRAGWIGFDTGHAFDVWLDPDVPESPFERAMREHAADLADFNAMRMQLAAEYGLVWTLEKLEAEINDLAAQVAAIRSRK